MAKTFLTNINLKGNQLLNAVIHSASSAPSALAAGQLYFNTGDSTFYYSTGTGTGNWSPVGVQYISAVGSNLSVTDGELNISGTPEFTSLSVTGNNIGTNIAIGDDAYIGDLNVSNHIVIQGQQDVTKGGIVFGSAKTEKISSNGTDLTLTADNDIILLPGSDYAYIGTPLLDGSNRIAKLSDITGDLTGYVTETGTQTLTNKTLDGVKVTGTTSFNDGSETQYLSISRSGTGTARITAADDLALRATNDVIIYPGNDVNGHTGKAYIHWGDDNWNAYPDREIATLGSIQGTADQISVDRSNSQATISLPSYINIPDGEMHLKKTEYWIGDNSDQYGIVAANPYSNEFSIASVNYPLHLESHTGDITLSPDTNNVYVNGNLTTSGGNYNITASNNVYAASGLYAGGADYENDGIIRVKDYNGENVFSVTADGNANGGQAVAEVKGQFDVYRPGAGGNKVAQISGDGDDNLVINATQNHLILQSDNNNSVYVGSVAADNKVATIGDLTSVQSGLTWKQAVNLLWDDPAANGSGNTGTLVIDGHAALTQAQDGYRILTTANGQYAGIYTYTDNGNTFSLVRSADADNFAELKGAAVFVEEGNNYGATAWVQQNHYITDFANQNWVQFSGQGTYIGSNSILIDGNQVSVILDSDSLEVTGSGLKVNYHTDGGLDNDSGLYVKTADGVKIDNSGNVAADYTAIESQLVTDGFVKSTDISDVTRKYSVDITPVTPFSNTTFTITHNLGTSDVIARVYQTYGPDNGADVEVDIKRTSTNALTVSFAAAPASGETYTVVIIG